MLLRQYQEVAVNAASDALDKYNNTLVVAPTGAGKTIMLSALVGKRQIKDKNVLVLQHRDELVNQNISKFKKVNPNINTSVVNATDKNWDGDSVFAMVQTLSRSNNLEQMPSLDMIVIDEAHHTVADTYQRIINAAKTANENIKIVGFTATPNRGDSKGLKDIFNNCSTQIEISTLINEGFLVPPKTYVIDVGVQRDLNEVRKTITDFDMDAVEKIMNKRAINKKVVEEWQSYAHDRKTIVFCSTINHAMDLCDEFKLAGVNCDIVTGETSRIDRERILKSLSDGSVQVVVNVAVLTEGFDAPPVSCVVLTRPCSYKSTMVQMIGRGLRTVNPEEYPNVIKTDCVVLDFGTSILTHGSLDESVNLDGADGTLQSGVAPEKQCPECDSFVPLSVRECPFCSHVFQKDDDNESISDFSMTEVELMDRSPFRWIDIFGTNKCVAATGFNGFAMVIEVEDNHVAIVRKKHGRCRTISIGTKVQAISAADDFMREAEDSASAKKTKRWLDDRMSDKQRDMLSKQNIQVNAFDFSWTKYRAACTLNYCWNRIQINNIVESLVNEQ